MPHRAPGGLLYLPYILGERSPRWNHEARGAFVGLSVTTGKGDISRSVLEGVGFNLKIILDILEQGAAVCGGVGIGAFKDFSVIHSFNVPVKKITPNAAAAPVYAELFDIFNEIYDALTGVYLRLAEFNRKCAGAVRR